MHIPVCQLQTRKELKSKELSSQPLSLFVSFGISLKCTEAPEEAVTTSQEQFLQLSCFISSEVKYIHTGLKNVRINSEK